MCLNVLFAGIEITGRSVLRLLVVSTLFTMALPAATIVVSVSLSRAIYDTGFTYTPNPNNDGDPFTLRGSMAYGGSRIIFMAMKPPLLSTDLSATVSHRVTMPVANPVRFDLNDSMRAGNSLYTPYVHNATVKRQLGRLPLPASYPKPTDASINLIGACVAAGLGLIGGIRFLTPMP